MKLDGKVLLIIVIAIAALYVLFSGTALVPGTIVSVSNINFDETRDVWVSNIVVNQTNDVVSFNQRYTTDPVEKTLSDGGLITAKSRVDVSFDQQQPYCDYPLIARNETFSVLFFPVSSVTYFDLGNPQKEVPYQVTVYKYPSIDLGGGRQIVETKLIDSRSGTTVNLAGGNIKINNLGQLSGGLECPGNAVLVPVLDSSGNVTEYTVYDKDLWDNRLTDLRLAANRLDFVGFLNILSLSTLREPAEWNNTNPLLNDITTQSNTLRALLPYTAGFSNVQMEIDADYADSIVYRPPNPIPQITGISLDSSNLVQSQTTTLRVTVKNVGTEGSIDLIPFNDKGYVQYTPTSNKITLGANGTGTREFQAYALIPGNDQVCIKAIGNQSGEVDEACTSITIQDNVNVPDPTPAPIPNPTPAPVGYCGDFVCNAGENFFTCPGDCPIVPTPGAGESELACLNKPTDFFIVGWDYVPAGFFNSEECNPQYNMIALAAIIAIIVIVGFILVILLRRKR